MLSKWSPDAGAPPPCPKRPQTAGSAAACHPHSPHPMAQGFVPGVSGMSQCPRCVLGFPSLISSSPPETKGHLVGLREVTSREKRNKVREKEKGVCRQGSP